MKKPLFLMMCIIFMSGLAAHAELKVFKRDLYSANGATLADITVSSETGSQTRKVYIIHHGNTNPKKFIWLFHGYKPEGDPYHQLPKIFIE
ncbi:MAG TPA: hypothetical protein VF857_04315, partial [Spirochaetota bacterium]